MAVERIKRLAQFLFDNAELISNFLHQSNNYRTVEIDLRVHKFKELQETPELDLGLVLYDEKVGIYDLLNHLITKERFAQLCTMINEDTGVIPPPDVIEVRDKLEE